MDGYSFRTQTNSNTTLTIFYAGAVKNGNKLTLVAFGKIERTGDVDGYGGFGCIFTMPASVRSKIVGQTLFGINSVVDNGLQTYFQSELETEEATAAAYADNLVTGMGNESSVEGLTEYLTSRGFEMQGGQWVYTGEDMKFTPLMIQEINNAYSDFVRNSGMVQNPETGELSATYSSKDDLKSALNTSIENRGEDLDYEIGYLFSNTANFSNGDVVVLINGKDPSKKAYVKNVNGAWVITTEDEYNKSSQKKQVKDGKYSDVSNADTKTQLQGNFDWEIDYLNDNLGNYQEGDTVKLINGADNSKVAYVKLVNGKWVVISSSEYTGSKSVSVSSGSGTKVTD